MKSARALESWRASPVARLCCRTCSDHDSTIKYSMYRPGLATSENNPQNTAPSRYLTVRGAGNKISGDQMCDFRCAFPLKVIDGYL